MSESKERGLSPLGLLVDLLAIWLGLYLRGLSWVRQSAAELAPDAPDWWWEWGAAYDLVLSGPDAGAWAANARALMEGGTLDLHRLPTYSWLLSFAGELSGDLVFGGHLLNHALSALCVPLTYLWARPLAGRAAAAGAMAWVALAPDLIASQLDYGVDPALQLSLLLLAAAALATAIRPWAAVLLGLAMGVAAGTHFLTLVFLPLALLHILGRPWGLRAAWLAGGLLSAGATWWLLMQPYPGLGFGEIQSIFAEGVAGSDGRGQGPSMSFGEASALVASRLSNAPELAVQRGLRGLADMGIPWPALVLLFYLGLLLPSPDRSRTRWERALPSLHLLAFLLPLVALEAARAPDRYALYARPFLFLCVTRGAVTSLAWLDQSIRPRLPRWPRGLLGSLAVLGLVETTYLPLQQQWNLFPPTDKGLALRSAGLSILEELGPGGGVATANQDLAFYTQRFACMREPCQGSSEAELQSCRVRLQQQCPGSGPLPYVIESKQQYGFGDQSSAGLDAWVRSEGTLLGRWTSREANYSVYLVDPTLLR